jgi:peptide/nickel transport system permease protein
MTSSGIILPIINLKDKSTQSRSFWQDAGLRILRDRLTLVALGILVLLTLVCLIGPPIVETVFKVDVNRTRMAERYAPPGPVHLLGTDNLGRDQFIRLLYGGRISLLIAYSASVLSILIGMILGIIAGFYSGWVDDLITWFVNTLSSIPGIFLLLIVATIWSPSPQTFIFVLVIFVWIDTCRLVRGQVLSLKERDYILAARALGSSNGRLMVYHIFPNVLSIVIINLTINAGALILIESGLSFIGLGITPPTPTWGNMLTEARSYFAKGAYLVFWPGMAITLTVLCFYLLGDGLRDALDPHSNRR